MKTYSVFAFIVICVIALNKAAAVSDSELLLKFQSAIEDCYEDDAKTIKVIITIADVESLIKSDPDPTRATKCLRFCLMKANNLYNEDNTTLNVNQVQALFKHVYPDIMDENKLMIIGESAEQCMSKASTNDRCERSHDLDMCMNSKLAEKGIEIKKF